MSKNFVALNIAMGNEVVINGLEQMRIQTENQRDSLH